MNVHKQILAELGGQLCYVWVTDAGSKGPSSPWNGRPANLDVYLNAMLAFAGHPSQSVNMTANELWNKFFRDGIQFCCAIFLQFRRGATSR